MSQELILDGDHEEMVANYIADCDEKLRPVFPAWSADALHETVMQALTLLQKHGTVEAAQASISDMAYGNVSISCRAHFQPIDKVLDAMDRLSLA